MKNIKQILFVLLGILALSSSQVLASASPTETVMELTEGTSEISSTSTDDKMEARQLVADAELYYADPAAPMGDELIQHVQQLKQKHPNFSTGNAVDFIYQRALRNNLLQ